MNWLIIALIFILLFYLWIRRGGKPYNFGRGIAKAQLTGIKRFGEDNLSKEDLYVKSILSRPGVERYFDEAKIRHNLKGNTIFAHLVEILAISEFQWRIGRLPNEDESNKIHEGIYSVIPDDL